MFCYVICIVANVLAGSSSDQKSGSRTIDVSGEDYGYIVSHYSFGLSRVWFSHNQGLTLTRFKSSKVDIEFEHLDLQESEVGECYNYLKINTLNRLCEPPADKITVDLSSTESKSINFRLVINSAVTRDDGFWLQYKGRL